MINPKEETLIQQAIQIVSSSPKPTIEFLQRRLKLGWNAAARTMDALVDRGIVSMDKEGKYTVIIPAKE